MQLNSRCPVKASSRDGSGKNMTKQSPTAVLANSTQIPQPALQDRRQQLLLLWSMVGSIGLAVRWGLASQCPLQHLLWRWIGTVDRRSSRNTAGPQGTLTREDFITVGGRSHSTPSRRITGKTSLANAEALRIRENQGNADAVMHGDARYFSRKLECAGIDT